MFLAGDCSSFGRLACFFGGPSLEFEGGGEIGVPVAVGRRTGWPAVGSVRLVRKWRGGRQMGRTAGEEGRRFRAAIFSCVMFDWYLSNTIPSMFIPPLLYEYFVSQNAAMICTECSST